MKTRKFVALAAGTLLAAGPVQASAAGAAGPASAGVTTAESASCTVLVSSCVTAPVQVDGVAVIRITTGQLGCSFQIRDMVSGNVTRQGRTFAPARISVAGLHGSYRLELFDCRPGSHGAIEG